MKRMDGIIFAFPKYIFCSSKFLCFLEGLDVINHMRKYKGYVEDLKIRDYRLFRRKKPFCIFAVSGNGKI
jgi:hypothetical protein